MIIWLKRLFGVPDKLQAELAAIYTLRQELHAVVKTDNPERDQSNKRVRLVKG